MKKPSIISSIKNELWMVYVWGRFTAFDIQEWWSKALVKLQRAHKHLATVAANYIGSHSTYSFSH